MQWVQCKGKSGTITEEEIRKRDKHVTSTMHTCEQRHEEMNSADPNTIISFDMENVFALRQANVSVKCVQSHSSSLQNEVLLWSMEWICV